jgi:hypothetical protein
MSIHRYPGSTDAPLRVRCRDISPMGIGIAHYTPLPLRSVFAVAICDPEPAVMLYVVVHCTSNSKGGYDIGARLTQVLRQRDTLKDDKKALSPRGQFMRSLLMTISSRTKMS